MVFLEVIHDSICTKMGEAGLHWLLSRRKFAIQNVEHVHDVYSLVYMMNPSQAVDFPHVCFNII